MKRITRILSLAAAVIALALPAGCQKDAFQEKTDLNLARCLQPTGLKATVSSTTGNVATFSWNVATDAESYILTIMDKNEAALQTLTLTPDQVPFSITLTADETYYFQVQAKNSSKGDSKVAQYVDDSGKLKSIKTFAVKDNLFPFVKERASTCITFAWDKDKTIKDFEEIDRIEYGAPGSEDVKAYTLTSDDIQGRTATVAGLTASTEYAFTLKFKSAARGQVDAWTLPDMTGLTEVSTAAALEQAIKDGANIKLTMAGSPYVIGTDDGINAPKGVKIYGEGSADSMPVIIGIISVPDAADGNNPSYYFEGVEFNGNDNTLGFSFQRAKGCSKDGIKVGSVTYKNCVITGYSKGIIYEWDHTLDIDEINYESTTIYAINADGSGGGDGFDLRKATKIGKLTFKDCTIYNGFRSFIRIDASPVIGDIVFNNNTVANLCFVDNTNNGGLFALQSAPSSITMKNNLFLNMGEKAKLVNENTKYKSFADLGIAASSNYFYGVPETFFTTNATLASVSGKTLESDPCYNAKAGMFNLISTSDIYGAGIGAAKWWTPYAKQPENLTQEALEGATTWDLNDAKNFSGTAKEKMVRNGIMICASEAYPIILGDGKIEFTDATPCTRKGVPTDNYLRFKVTEPGSVVVHPASNSAAHVIIATCSPVDGEANPASVSVKGGAAFIDGESAPTKIVIKDIVEETMILVYASNALSLDAIAWSKDTSNVNTALPAPKPTAEPTSITAGESTNVVVSWEAVDNADSYSIVFNEKSYEGTFDPLTGLWSLTIQGMTASMLDAGSYKVDVYANPAKGDLYNTMSEAGSTSFAVLPKGGGGETELVVKSVEELKAAMAAGKTTITLDAVEFDLSGDTDWAGIMPVTAPLALTGKDGASVKGSISIAGEVGDVSFNNIAFTKNGSDNFINLLNDPAVNATSITVSGCTIEGYKQSVLYGSYPTINVDKINFIGNVIKNPSAGQGVFDLRQDKSKAMGNYGEVNIIGNTIIGGRDLLRLDSGGTAGTVKVMNNTLDGVCLEHSNGILYVRANVSSYIVSKNLVLNEIMSGKTTVLSKKGCTVPTNMSGNYFYNINEKTLFTGAIDSLTATFKGAILKDSPVKDLANNDYTLTNGVLIADKVGAPKWQTGAVYCDQEKVTVKNAGEFQAAIDAGKVEIILAAEGSPYNFTESTFTVPANLHLVGEAGSMPEFHGCFKIGGTTDLGTLIFDNIKFCGDKAIGCTFTIADAPVARVIQIKNCVVDGFTHSVYYNPEKLKADVQSLIISNVSVQNHGTSQDVFDIRVNKDTKVGGVYGEVSITNCTVKGGRALLRADAGTVTNCLRFCNNTVDGSNLGINSNYIMYVRATPTVFKFTNNLFLNEKADGKTVSWSKTSGVTVPTEASSNFVWNYDEDNFFSGQLNKVTGGAVTLSYCPVKDATNGDYTLTDALCLSSNIGALKWNPNRGKVTSEITVTSLEEFVNALDAGKAGISVKADSIDFTKASAEATSFSGGVLTLTRSVTLKGIKTYGKAPVIKGGFKLNTGVADFVAQGINFVGGGQDGGVPENLIDVIGSLSAGKIQIRDCEISKYVKGLIYNAQSVAGNIGNLDLANLYVHDIGTSKQALIDIRRKVYGSVVLENSTIYNGCRDFVRLDTLVTQSVCIRNNTIAAVSIDQSNSLLYVRSIIGDKYAVENNLFLNETGSTTILAKKDNKIPVQVPLMKNNFFFNCTSAKFWSGSIDQASATANGGGVLEADPCTDSANGKFKLINQELKNLGVGDPRWR